MSKLYHSTEACASDDASLARPASTTTPAGVRPCAAGARPDSPPRTLTRPRMLVAFALTCALGAFLAMGCSSSAPAKEDVNANVPAGAPSLMPESHEGRFESLGAAGCYGCHGANEQANPQLKAATVLPEDHYAAGSSSSLTLDPTHEQCITCHAQA